MQIAKLCAGACHHVKSAGKTFVVSACHEKVPRRSPEAPALAAIDRFCSATKLAPSTVPNLNKHYSPLLLHYQVNFTEAAAKIASY